MINKVDQISEDSIPNNDVTHPLHGVASVNLAISDRRGFVMRHGTTNDILAAVNPENLDQGDWDKLMAVIDDIVDRGNGRRL